GENCGRQRRTCHPIFAAVLVGGARTQGTDLPRIRLSTGKTRGRCSRECAAILSALIQEREADWYRRMLRWIADLLGERRRQGAACDDAVRGRSKQIGRRRLQD